MPTKPDDAVGHVAGEKQCDPAAHRRADQDLRAFGQNVDHRGGVLAPVGDRTVDERAVRAAVTRVVEPQEERPVASAQACSACALVPSCPSGSRPGRPRPGFCRGLVIGDVAALRRGEKGCHDIKIAIVVRFRQGRRNPRAKKNRAWLDLGRARGHKAARHNPPTGRFVGAKLTRETADGPDFPDISRRQQA